MRYAGGFDNFMFSGVLIYIMMAGYRMPHPLVNDCHIKVQTMNHRTTPIKVFQAALQDLTDEVGNIERSFNVCETFSNY